MEKNSKIVQLVLWALVAVLLTAFLCHQLAFGGFRLFWPSGWNWDWNFNGFSADSQLSTDYSGSFPVSGVKKITVEGGSMDVILTNSDGDTIGVTDRSTDSASGKSDVAVSLDGGELKITGRNWNSGFVLFGIGRREQLEISLPASYTGDLGVGLASGDTTIRTASTFGNMDISSASGDISGGGIRADTFRCRVTSGDIRLQSLQVKTYDISSTSGDINLENIDGAGSIGGTSGDVRVSYGSIGGNSSISEKSGDIRVALSRSIGADIAAKCVSGDIQADFPLQYAGRMKNSASGTVGPSPYSRLELSTISGDIELSQG